ncbi:DUF2306 domain-containing protein [Nocardioides cavernaquae]|uniref:DUF2306 domain-containing protein n=1 Tax=Nocardioides cavernaquae TaxID=2321396 RepID=A0A3A5H564_9ACTN|nr:DUF2306 domain-containing protein [Nocardioides cavernaquae]RJS45008.1 DUF2306 domain-containing protein [Nocardioides cavernaquae]
MQKRLATIGWFAVAATVLLYAPMAAEFMARFFGGGPQLWDHAFTAVVGSDRATGPGSIHFEQHDVYERYRWVLLTHTALAAIAISLAVFQFTARSRVRLGVHRWIGRAQVTLTLVAMGGAMTYLVVVGPHRTYDGPAFYLQLWALAIATALATALGWLAIRRGHQASHRILMAFAFALLCTAPFLRVLYMLFGLAWPDASQEVTNLAGGAVEAVWAPMAAVLASRMVPAARKREHLAPLPGRWLDRVALGLGAVGLTALVAAYVDVFDGVDRVTITAAVAIGLGILLTQLNLRAASDPVAHEEWRIHAVGMLAGIPTTLALWGSYTLVFTTEESFYGALLTGPAVPLSLGLLLIAWRRRRPARIATPVTVTA